MVEIVGFKEVKESFNSPRVLLEHILTALSSNIPLIAAFNSPRVLLELKSRPRPHNDFYLTFNSPRVLLEPLNKFAASLTTTTPFNSPRVLLELLWCYWDWWVNTQNFQFSLSLIGTLHGPCIRVYLDQSFNSPWVLLELVYSIHNHGCYDW